MGIYYLGFYFSVDNIPIRVYKNYIYKVGRKVPFTRDVCGGKHMEWRILGIKWEKVEWSQAPFQAHYQEFEIHIYMVVHFEPIVLLNLKSTGGMERSFLNWPRNNKESMRQWLANTCFMTIVMIGEETSRNAKYSS